MKKKVKILFKYMGILVGGLLFVFEIYNICIDIYNFSVLKRIKPILENISNSEEFYNLSEFNDKYNVGITPIRNCYYISSSNGKEKYIFGFQFESVIFKILFFSSSYVYPKYNLPYTNFCTGYGESGCYDKALDDYKYIISHPCEK